MNTKATEIHLITLNQGVQLQSSKEAIDDFLTAPSFSTKQKAMETFWKQITQNSGGLVHSASQG